MPRSLIYALLLLLTGVTLATAAPTPEDFTFSFDRTPAEEHLELQAATELAANGQTDEALSALRQFILAHPESPLLPRASAQLGRLFLDRKQPAEALTYLDHIPADRQTAGTRLLQGLALIDLGRFEEGIDRLQGIDDGDLTVQERSERLLALAEGNAGLGRPLPALVFLDQTLSQPEQVPSADPWPLAHRLIAGLSDDQLKEAAFLLRTSPLADDLTLQQALRAWSRGEAATAQGWTEVILAASSDFPYRGEAADLWQKITGRTWLQRTIGVMLPLSGRYAPFGERVRRGIEMAIAQQDKETSGVRFVFLDSGSDAEQSARTATKLIRDYGVMTILGPLTGSAAVAAAEVAQQAGVPLLTLSPRENLPAIGDCIFRNTLTSQLQIRTLVGYVMEEAGIRSFAVLYPENRLGRELADLFRSEVAKRGGEIAASQSYEETATDFRAQIRTLQGLPPGTPEPSKTETAQRPAQPRLPYQALFIADYAEKVGLIAPQLTYYGLEGIQLLGINGWNSPELLRTAGPHVEGAIFVDGFFRNSPFPFVQNFVELALTKYGEEPTILEAQGFDCAGILLSLLGDSEVKSREELRRRLAGLRNYPGLTGATSFAADGEAEKTLYLLQIQHGDIVQIN